MITFKTQIEIRYTPILNFRDVYKPIVSPFLKNGKFEIPNENTIQEQIKITYVSEGTVIDIRWDRIVFICDGKPSNLFLPKGPLFFYLSIFEKLKKLQEFGEITNLLLADWSLLEIDNKENEIIRDFKKSYLNNVPKLDNTEADLGISIDFREKEDIVKLMFGPYRSKSDIDVHNLRPISSKDTLASLNKKGILLHAIVVENTNQMDLSQFKKLEAKIETLFKQITI